MEKGIEVVLEVLDFEQFHLGLLSEGAFFGCKLDQFLVQNSCRDRHSFDEMVATGKLPEDFRRLGKPIASFFQFGQVSRSAQGFPCYAKIFHMDLHIPGVMPNGFQNGHFRFLDLAQLEMGLRGKTPSFGIRLIFLNRIPGKEQSARIIARYEGGSSFLKAVGFDGFGEGIRQARSGGRCRCRCRV